MSTVGGDGIRHFRRPDAANVVTIFPRLRDGTGAAYVCPDDVRLVALDADQKPLHVQVQFNMTGDGKIVLRYTLGDDYDSQSTELRVCVRVCGVLLADVYVRAAFDGRVDGRLCSQHALTTTAFSMAIHPAGTHLVVSKKYSEQNALNVYGLPDMNLLTTLNSLGDGLSGLHATRSPQSGLCFTDAGTLLVADYRNNHVQHLTLEGQSTAKHVIHSPICVASRGNMMAVGTNGGVNVRALESGATIHVSPSADGVRNIQAIVFVDDATLAVANGALQTVSLCTLTGGLIKHLACDIYSFGLVVCADGCLLVSDYGKSRIRMFVPDGTELTASPLVTHMFQTYPRSIALCGERVYASEGYRATISVFK